MTLKLNKIRNDLTLVGINDPEEKFLVPPEPHSMFKYFLDDLRKQLKTVDGLKEKAWMIDYCTRDELKYGEIIPRVTRFCSYLRNTKGIQKGDVIHMLTDGDHLDTVTAVLAIWALGAIPAFGEVTLIDDAIKDQLLKCSSKALICSKKSLDRINQITAKTKAEIITLEELQSGPATDSLLEAFIPDMDIENDLVAIMFSSGTTGFPKAIPYTHAMLWDRWLMTNTSQLCPDANDVSGVPITKALIPIAYMLYSINRNTCILNLGSGDTRLRNFVKAINEFKPGNISITGFEWVMLWKSGMLTTLLEDGGSVKTLWPIAATLPMDCESFLLSIFPNVEILNCYGSNEIGLLTMGSTCANLGRLKPGIEMKVKDFTTGARLGPGQTGLLCFKNSRAMKAYLGDPEKSKAYFDEEGFGEIGDVGYYDQDGFFYIEGRINDLIRCDYVAVHCTVLENALLCHPMVVDCGVFAKRCDLRGEVPAAWVVLRNEVVDKEETTQNILDFANSLLKKREAISGGLRIVEKIPRNQLGKIMRHKMINLKF